MPTSLVVDASFTLKLILPNAEQTRCQELMAEWMHAGINLVAPTLWLYEVTSALTKAVYFEILADAEGRQALELAQALDLQLIQPDNTLVPFVYDWTRRLNRAAAYDSFYLALSESLSTEFWTADQRLVNAVNVSWVHYITDNVN
jgi:predicted nucleic acid-binding protein